MFTDSEVTISGFPTSRGEPRAGEDSSTQTLEISKENQNTQTVNLQAIGVQTDGTDERAAETKYDESNLAEFLNRVCPAVITELDRVCRSNAFASYSLLSEEDEVIEKLRIANPLEGVKVADLSWSATGSVLAVACCHTLHTGWCDHQGLVALHNVDRDRRAPSYTLNATSCVRSVSMHPFVSSIVAAGTLSGEVLVWDTARDATFARVTPASHNDSVTQVRWTLGTGSSVTLASSALDGHLILWKVSPHLSSYQVMDRYTFGVSGCEGGVSAFAFPHHQQDVFVVCLEGGAMMHCSTTVAKLATSVGSLEQLKDPVIGSFEKLPATVTCLEFSPNHDDVFATVSTDQAIRIFSLSQRYCQRVIWSGAMVGVSWSPVQAHVLAAWGHASKVKLYNASTGDDLAPLTPDYQQAPDTQISCVRFNSKSPRLLAVGDLTGKVGVWEIPSLVSTKTEAGVN